MSMIKNKTLKNDLWAVCAEGRRVFGYQIDKTLDVKRQIMQSILRENCPDYLMFGRDLQVNASYLCDSKRFTQECEELQLNPGFVAQHVVFEGFHTFNKVRNHGVKAVFDSQVHEFNQPLI